MGQFASGILTEGQAIKENAKKILLGEIDGE